MYKYVSQVWTLFIYEHMGQTSGSRGYTGRLQVDLCGIQVADKWVYVSQVWTLFIYEHMGQTSGSRGYTGRIQVDLCGIQVADRWVTCSPTLTSNVEEIW